jgi:cobalt-precorrin-5B (C1)-methyltransferase
MAAGKLQTHVAGSEVDLDFLAELAVEAGGSAELAAQIRTANTARHVLELCRAAGLVRVTSAICERVAHHLSRHAGGALDIHVVLVDFGGALLGRHPKEVSP